MLIYVRLFHRLKLLFFLLFALLECKIRPSRTKIEYGSMSEN